MMEMKRIAHLQSSFLKKLNFFELYLKTIQTSINTEIMMIST